ncbi:MAG: chromosome segregation protein SMC [Planctomycetaceae bacterium]|jgi:chromosome segregation protein|nr:chromosome segregation protein SMC [Planctomycetaceae bacterium]
MLKAIELSGFKSFADRTRMEFALGISALVGPNGSGKSNIVDAIKWVLGEQSIKKLRGNEMTDVIFNGSGTRQPVNTAEVTLTFDNSQRIFDLDASEIHITRRVYRSGEAEYLINRQLSRLKDVKDILSGTGLGTQAYGIIEQGRVELLLQSSPQQRRAIFEEAAGISRFNTKKAEVQRRLERVEQNILRLSDIVSEIETQLRNTKSQAGKAQLYRQYTTRLQELRIHAGWIDWRKWSAQVETLREETVQLTVNETSLLEQTEHAEKQLFGIDKQLEELSRESKSVVAEIAGITERIVGEDSTIELQTAQIEEIESEIQRNGQQLQDLTLRSTDTDEMMRKTDDEIRAIDEQHRQVVANYEQHLALTDELAEQYAKIEEKRDSMIRELDANHRLTNRLAGEISGFESRQQGLVQSRLKSEKRLAAIRQQTVDLKEQLAKHRTLCEEIAFKAECRQEQLDNAKKRKIARQEKLETLRGELLDKKQRQSGTSERIAVLEELLRRHEGLSPGVKEVLRQPRTPDSSYRFVHGLVADLFRVHVEAASLIEIALGQAAQHIVVSPEPEIIRAIERSSGQLAGRVGFLWLDTQSNDAGLMRGSHFEGRAGVHGRADRFVETDPQYSFLARRLLGHTWLVETLQQAKSLYRESDGRTNFLTVAGEYLAADGTLVVGPLHGTSGLISRRSELRTLSEQLTRIESDVRDLELNRDLLQSQLNEDEQTLERATREHQQAVSELESQRIKAGNAEEQWKQTETQANSLEEEAESLDAQHETAAIDLELAQTQKEELDSAIEQIEAELEITKQKCVDLDEQRRDLSRKTTNIKIELAKREERLDFLHDRRKQYEEHQKERFNLLEENRKQDALLKSRVEQASLAILKIESNLAMLYYRKEGLAATAKQIEESRLELTNARAALNYQLKHSQSELNKTRTELHNRQLETERLRQETRTLTDRMREDYNVDISEWQPSNKPDCSQRLKIYSPNNTNKNNVDKNNADENDSDENINNEADADENENENESVENISPESEISQSLLPENYQAEIDDLRLKIQKIGSVNLEAIETLETLETRCTTLSNQYYDLLNAKKAIERIIDRINGDSQQLFEETFNGVKEHFRHLFQKLFGGGHADLILEDEAKPLESGVEIVARPPGKELKSVTLMSGGEKTMTCVALLLALFNFRPSPICILDEVDAALDEANIDRFARVVKEYEDKTQFLIVTHSKKTMAAANTMYGVTMQESGVSIPISVRFVDVGENGEINIADKDAA